MPPRDAVKLQNTGVLVLVDGNKGLTDYTGPLELITGEVEPFQPRVAQSGALRRVLSTTRTRRVNARMPG